MFTAECSVGVLVHHVHVLLFFDFDKNHYSSRQNRLGAKVTAAAELE